MEPTKTPLWRLTASEALALMRSDALTVTTYTQSLLSRIHARDSSVQAWAHLDTSTIASQAHHLDSLPSSLRGPLHGLPIAVKDVIYTRDMPTQHSSPLYKDSFPVVDAAAVRILRQAGALIFGKTTTTEFAAIHVGTKTRNPHDDTRTPGGSSAGSGAAVADFQVPLALGTQTGGSTIRPASFNGVYGFKPTWNAVSREGAKVYALTLDTLGLYARCVDDLQLLADVFAFEQDEQQDDEVVPFGGIAGALFGICKTSVWPQAGAGTQAALAHAASLLRAHGAIVEDVDLDAEFSKLEEWHHVVLLAEGRTTFLPEYRVDKTAMHPLLVSHVENPSPPTRKQHLAAVDGISSLRPRMDAVAGRYAALVTPSVPDEAPVGLTSTGSHAFCSMWTALHNPVLNVPGFRGTNDMPIGLSLVAPRYRDRHLLKVGKAVGDIFEAEGGWKREDSS